MAAVPAALGVVLDAAGIEGAPLRSLYLPDVATVAKVGLPLRSLYAPLVATFAKPVTILAGTAVIGIVILPEPSNDCPVAVTPDKPIVLAVASFSAVLIVPTIPSLAYIFFSNTVLIELSI